MLEFPVQRETCCHTGGGMVWDDQHNLFITVGNNTGNSRMAQTDERPGRSSWDDQRGAANTNDLRGKILRIHPEDDGTYSIPEGNLFTPGEEGTRPEIYTMGHRNVWRVSIDSKTGYIYWGEVGPDATEDTEIGPRGYDELNQAKGPGNHGWPYFIGENHAYPLYDFAADAPLAPKDPVNLVNTSVNNTGVENLPPAEPAFIAYPYGVSEKYPLLGSGGRSATGGPVYRQADFGDAARAYPAYYEGKWLAADLSRGWIMAITMDENSDYVSMERFLPDYKPAEIIDMKFGPQGDLYVLEYGSRWFRDSDDDKLVRIEYNAGNRTPVVAASVDKPGGKVPFEATFSSEGTIDYDGDELQYAWQIEAESGSYQQQFTTPNPTVTFDQEGVYMVSLTVADPSGAENTTSLRIIAGNEPPAVDLQLSGNTSFFFPDTAFDYSVTVTDDEDGTIDPSHVAVSIDYASEGFDYAEVMQGQRSVDATTRYAVAKALMDRTDCGVCHQTDVRSAGPSYTEIAEKYSQTPEVIEALSAKIVDGGSGVWGEIMMPAHPSISKNDAKLMTEYIMNVQDRTLGTLPLSGTYSTNLPEGDNGRGSIIVRAAYEDQGAGDIPSQATEQVVILRAASIQAGDADVMEGVRTALGRNGAGPINVMPSHNGYIAFHDVDLTGITSAAVTAQAMSRNGTVGGEIEFRLGGPDGDLLGQASVAVTEFRFGPPPTATQVQQTGGQNANAGNPPQNQQAGGNNQQQNQPANTQATGAPQGQGNQGGGFRRRFGPQPVNVAFKETSGRHDLYLVFRNADARSIDPLFTLSTIDLQQ